MTVTIALTAETEAKLRERSAATGKDVTALVREAIEEKFSPVGEVGEDGQLSPEELDRVFDEFFAANPEKMPSLPVDFSRADIYEDHD